MSLNRRSKHLIDPAIQLRIGLALAGAAAGAVVVEALLLLWALTMVAVQLPTEGTLILERLPIIITTCIGVSLIILVPLTVSAGILMTHRLVGPLHSFRRYITALNQGEDPGPCVLRKKDHLQDLCALLNEVTQTVRQRNAQDLHGHAQPSPQQLFHSEADTRSAG